MQCSQTTVKIPKDNKIIKTRRLVLKHKSALTPIFFPKFAFIHVLVAADMYVHRYFKNIK